MANEEWKEGDHVTWNSPQGEVEGMVTEEKTIKGHIAKASKEHPEVEVKSSKTGKTAIHKPEGLKKVGKE
jgi:hypothetical protein